MAQDYARHRDRSGSRSGRRAATRTPPPSSTHWNWFIAGVLTGLFGVFIGYVGIANFGSARSGEAPVQQVVVAEEDLPVFSFYRELANARVEVGTPSAPAPAPQATAPAQQQAQQQQQRQAQQQAAAQQTAPKPETVTTTTAQNNTAAATPPPALAATTTPAATVASNAAGDTRQYLLQAGSFQDRQDAENRRAKIILLNLNANVVPGVVAGRTWQRVQVGPFNGRQAAEAARALLSENNIDSIPLLVR